MINKYIEQLNIDLIETYLDSNKAISLNLCKNKKYIIISKDINSISERNSCLYHELGHCYTDSFYTEGSSAYERTLCEDCAERWAIINCCPFDEYLKAIEKGVRNIYDLSAFLNITVEFADKIAKHYEGRLTELKKRGELYETQP